MGPGDESESQVTAPDAFGVGDTPGNNGGYDPKGPLAQHRRFGEALAAATIEFVPEHPGAVIAFSDWLCYVMSIDDIEHGRAWEHLPLRYLQLIEITEPALHRYVAHEQVKNGGQYIDRRERPAA